MTEPVTREEFEYLKDRVARFASVVTTVIAGQFGNVFSRYDIQLLATVRDALYD